MANTITYNAFKGSLPRAAPNLVGAGFGHLCINVDATSGHLEPFRDSEKVLDTNDATKTVHKLGCCWVEFPTCTSVVTGSVGCGEYYATGVFDWPVRIDVGPDCQLVYRRLGLPCPTIGPEFSIAQQLGDPKDVESRAYCYAYVNAAGVESQLSPGSSVENVRDGDICYVTGWDVPAPEFEVVKVAIFRTLSGCLSGQMPSAFKIDKNEKDTFWMLVGYADINDLGFTDEKINEELSTARDFEMRPPPPVGLTGLGRIANMDTLFGFVGRTLYFSKNNDYDAWPHRFLLDDNIKAVVESAGNIFVATDGSTYVLSADNDCKSAGCRTITRSVEAMPYAACGPNHIAAVPGGAAFPSHDGLAMVTKANTPSIITLSLYSQQMWHEKVPQSIYPIFHKGILYCFGATGGFYITKSAGSGDGWLFDSSGEVSDKDVLSVFESREGELFLHTSNGVYQWEASPLKREYYFESAHFIYVTVQCFYALNVRVRAGGKSIVRVFADGRKVGEFEAFMPEQTFLLPSWARGFKWYFTISGTGVVESISLSTDIGGLSA